MINQERVGVQVAARTPVCIETTLWRSQRMDSLSDKPSGPQIRCLPLCGHDDDYRFVKNIQGKWEPLNYSFVCWMVANQRWLKNKSKAAA
ncbi:hypothetical protein [Serratia sp. M24T3]|uniref:hypothetical protein n=1 Tax=Serratia sp. M24T3 TaxID=932213 RepID=UPI00025BB64D|nr:hypothetical protein [Serratia sp. M24T3]EIC83338.1 hypothetical protein SPM24T3_17045 [Serratia sp. M24T3]